MNLYEAVVILDTNAETDQIIDAIAKQLESMGAEEIKIDRWGKKRFAYEIKRRQYGDYSSFMFQATPEAIKEIESNFRITEDILRSLIYRVSKAQLKQIELDKVAKEEAPKQ